MPQMSMGAAMAYLAARDPERAAITHDGVTISRRELDLSSNRLARDYQQRGVKQDDFVTVALPNSIEAYQAYLAIWKLGATPQPISSRLPFVERDAIISLANPALVVGVNAGEHQGAHGPRPSVPVGHRVDPTLSDAPLPDKVAKHWKAPTSGGSTGRPKLIVAGQPSLIDPDNYSTYGQRVDGCQLVPGPLYHNAPFAWSTRALLSGNHLVVMTRFDAELALRLIVEHRVDFVLLVPTMMLRMWRLGDAVRGQYDISCLNGMIHMAAPCPAWLKECWIQWLGAEKVWELYAGTEAQTATILRGDEWLKHRGSVGKSPPGTLRVLDAEGRDVPPGVIAEVFMRPLSGAGSTYHYIGAKSKQIQDGWESLGDMGYLDEDGYLYLADRQTDMILSGGANIYPAEVEAAIDAHPSVRSSCVIGLPDEDMGNLVHAIVDTAGQPLGAAELSEFLADRLAKYKIPRTYEFVATPVRDDAGKVRRTQLRAERIST